MKLLLTFVLFIAVLNLEPLYADDKADLVGVWRFVGETDTRANGSPAPLQTHSPSEGLLIYTADGFMSVTIMPRDRKWTSDTATIDELRETIANGTAYAGRYEVDPATHTVTHINSVNLEPGYNDAPLVRTYSLHGDTLELSGTFFFQGGKIKFVLTWQRVNSVN
jgi:hypothetical protein